MCGGSLLLLPCMGDPPLALPWTWAKIFRNMFLQSNLRISPPNHTTANFPFCGHKRVFLVGVSPNVFFSLESQYFYYLRAHAKIQTPTTTTYQKFAFCPSKISLAWKPLTHALCSDQHIVYICMISVHISPFHCRHCILTNMNALHLYFFSCLPTMDCPMTQKLCMQACLSHNNTFFKTIMLGVYSIPHLDSKWVLNNYRKWIHSMSDGLII